MGNSARQQEENLFFYFKSFYKRMCVCMCVVYSVCICAGLGCSDKELGCGTEWPMVIDKGGDVGYRSVRTTKE